MVEPSVAVIHTVTRKRLILESYHQAGILGLKALNWQLHLGHPIVELILSNALFAESLHCLSHLFLQEEVVYNKNIAKEELFQRVRKHGCV